MICYSFIPRWRTSGEIEVVLHPHAGWFRKFQSVRFALMEDGDLLFGDANVVMHEDMCGSISNSGAKPLLAGIMLLQKGVWRFGYVQYFATGSNRATTAKKLLRKNTDWLEAMRALGQDPCSRKTFEELGHP